VGGRRGAGVSATVIPLPRRTDWEPELSKRQLAATLGYTTRWVELRVREGMPSRMWVAGAATG
jgi:hypothetical protein